MPVIIPITPNLNDLSHTMPLILVGEASLEVLVGGTLKNRGPPATTRAPMSVPLNAFRAHRAPSELLPFNACPELYASMPPSR